MARTRYAIDADSGLLVDRDGNSLGRVVSITVESAPVRGKGMGVGSGKDTASGTTSSSQGGVGDGARPTASSLEAEAVRRIWGHYLEALPSKRVLDRKRQTIIRNALHTVKAAQQCDLETAEALVKQAITGLSLSPWHNGENPQRKKYLELRHALKGKDDESDDERIEKAIGWSVVYASNRPQGLDPDTALRYMEEIRYFISKQAINPDATTGRSQAVAAYGKLKSAGYKVLKLDKPPWARFDT